MKFIITLDWHEVVDNDGEHIDRENYSKNLTDELKEHGVERANDMIQQGYREGELIYETDEVYCRGWWKIKEQED